nr:hypothetical protein [uncultured Roseobacter sp.]
MKFSSGFPERQCKNGEFSGGRHGGLFETAPHREPDSPGFQRRISLHTADQRTGCFVQKATHGSIATLGYAERMIDLTGLMLPRRQARERSNFCCFRKPPGSVGQCQKAQGDNWACDEPLSVPLVQARWRMDRHQSTRQILASGNSGDLILKCSYR